MLIGIPPVISPELLKVLAEMGHTDEITIGDANFPGHTYGKKVIRLDGICTAHLLEAILQLMPLDSYVVHPVTLMQVGQGDTTRPLIWDEYQKIVAKYDDRGKSCFEEIDKWEFYEKTRNHSAAVVITGETALYANLILKKGVIKVTTNT